MAGWAGLAGLEAADFADVGEGLEGPAGGGWAALVEDEAACEDHEENLGNRTTPTGGSFRTPLFPFEAPSGPTWFDEPPMYM